MPSTKGTGKEIVTSEPAVEHVGRCQRQEYRGTNRRRARHTEASSEGKYEHDVDTSRS